MTMLSVREIKEAISELEGPELAELRTWFEHFEAARFDRRIEQDARSGKLDKLADQALDDFRKGRAREL
jgi:hypothetical protein